MGVYPEAMVRFGVYSGSKNSLECQEACNFSMTYFEKLRGIYAVIAPPNPDQLQLLSRIGVHCGNFIIITFYWCNFTVSNANLPVVLTHCNAAWARIV